MSIRTERVAGEVQQAVALLLQTEFSEMLDGLVTVTKVRMAPDLRNGRVYLSVLGSKIGSAKLLQKIKDEAPHLRSGVGRMVRLKFTPELFYYLDDTQEEVARVEEIFRKIHADDAKKGHSTEEHPVTENEVPDAI